MKWFKHMSDMAHDVRVKRIIRKHGVEGYGLYVYIIERVVAKLDTESPFPDLEETSEDIAFDIGMTPAKVEEIMWSCIEQGLFDQDEVTGRIIASKIYKFLQSSETRSEEIRAMISAYKTSNKLDMKASQTVTDNYEEQNRREQKRTEESVADDKTEIEPEVFLSDSELHKLSEKYGRRNVEVMATRLSAYMAEKGKVYNDHYRTLNNWLKKDGAKPEAEEVETVLPDWLLETVDATYARCAE